MRLPLLFISFALTGSLALPQGAPAPPVSLPGVNLAPAQTACIEVCSAQVANADPAALNACVSTGTIPPACFCGDARLAPEMQSCLATRCPSLKGRCAAILGGTAFIAPASSAPSVGIPGAGVDQQSNEAPGTPGQVSVSGPSTGATAESHQGANIVGGDFPSASFPDVPLSVADQTDCIRRCSQQVAGIDQGILMTCASQTGNAARCLCSNRNLRSDMQLCFQSTCPPLAGRCAAIFGTQAFGDSRSPGQATIPSASPAPVPPGGAAAGPSSPDPQDDDDGRSASFPDLPLSPAAQSDCIRRCSQQVSGADERLLTACARATGNPAECLCTDRRLRADMELCFQDTCPDLSGRCAAILGSGIFVAGVPGSPGTASPGSSSPGTSSAGTSSPGRPAPGNAAPGSPAPGNAAPGTSTPDTAAQGPQEDATGGSASDGPTNGELGTPTESANDGEIPDETVAPIVTVSTARTPLALSGTLSSTISISTTSVATDVPSPSSGADNAPSGGLDAGNGARSNAVAVLSILAGPAALVVVGLLF